MTTVHDVPAEAYIAALQEELADEDAIEAPEWAAVAKTSVDRELPPEDPDWWTERVAAICRRVYTDGPIGVSKLKNIYGGLKRNGMEPAHHEQGSGSVIRAALQQLEDAGLVEQQASDGRVVSADGRSRLDAIADDVASDIPELEGY